jgi:hypothetical protein
MKVTFSGSVHFANGDPISNVEVRIFDKDAQGKQDDDLTITPGLSDDQGHFSLTYEPLRYLDYHTLHLPGNTSSLGNSPVNDTGVHLPDLADIYLPYLRFDYTFNGLNYEYTASLGLFQARFYLPENPPLEFLPSIHGFKFKNSFSGYFLPFSTPDFITSSKVSSNYGLCGGMSFGAYDFALAGRPVPAQTDVPRQGTRLQRYLYRRQMDSLGGLGQQVVRVAQWTTLPNDTLMGIHRRTADEFSQIRLKLDGKNPLVLALIYEHATSLGGLSKVIFNNHQVLAYAYQSDQAGGYAINIYDPNLPGRDDVLIRAQRVLLGEEPSPSGPQPVIGLKSSQILAGTHYKDIRGFFCMTYKPVTPSDGL